MDGQNDRLLKDDHWDNPRLIHMQKYCHPAYLDPTSELFEPACAEKFVRAAFFYRARKRLSLNTWSMHHGRSNRRTPCHSLTEMGQPPLAHTCAENKARVQSPENQCFLSSMSRSKIPHRTCPIFSYSSSFSKAYTNVQKCYICNIKCNARKLMVADIRWSLRVTIRQDWFFFLSSFERRIGGDAFSEWGVHLSVCRSWLLGLLWP